MYAGVQRSQGDGTMMPEEVISWAMPEQLGKGVGVTAAMIARFGFM